ncbi:hypothetical protein ACW9HR_32510 [Nocardia gipuzkoensis]
MSSAEKVAGLAEYYGRVRVLDEKDLEVPTVTVMGLLGPNLAGKTTTFDTSAPAVAAFVRQSHTATEAL